LPEECIRRQADSFVEKSNIPDKFTKKVKKLFRNHDPRLSGGPPGTVLVSFRF